MATSIFVNLPVKDLNKSKDFFNHLGYSFNPQFTNDDAACMVVSDTIYVMLLTEPFFKNFTKKDIVDAKKSTEVLVCLSCENRDQVNDIINKAVAAGATTPLPAQDHGFMYSHSLKTWMGINGNLYLWSQAISSNINH